MALGRFYIKINLPWLSLNSIFQWLIGSISNLYNFETILMAYSILPHTGWSGFIVGIEFDTSINRYTFSKNSIKVYSIDV